MSKKEIIVITVCSLLINAFLVNFLAAQPSSQSLVVDENSLLYTTKKFRRKTVVCRVKEDGKRVPGLVKTKGGQMIFSALNKKLRKFVKGLDLAPKAGKKRLTKLRNRYKRACAKAGETPDPTQTATPQPSATASPTGDYLIVDHNAVADFENIPDYWLEQAKQLTIHYAHTSHGSQINSGLAYLEQYVDAQKYSFARRSSSSTPGLPAVETPPALRMYDGNPPETYITPEDYWSTNGGINRTKAVADTGVYSISLWSWCGQQSSNTVATVNQYLSVMNNFESEYPSMRFIYMTGHTDGGGDTLTRNNKMVRDYVIANDKILFDFADIESWDPDGNYYADTSDDCSWCSDWCASNPADCQNLPSCAHSHGFNCVQKGKAFWWMMARLAGWEG
jgi:hypothetical protein